MMQLQQPARSAVAALLRAAGGAAQSTALAGASQAHAVVDGIAHHGGRLFAGVTSSSGRHNLLHSADHASSSLRQVSSSFATRALGLSRVSHGLNIKLGSIWQKYNGFAYAGAGALSVLLLWKGTSWAASYVTPEFSHLEHGLLGAACAAVVASALLMRNRTSISPERVYWQAMSQVNSSASVREVLGSPLVGSDVALTVMSCGGLRMKNLKLQWQAPRVQMVWQLSGPERQGLVSVEAKKLQGQVMLKLLSVDVQQSGTLEAIANAKSDKEAGYVRMYLVGDEKLYKRGGLMWELRKPYLKAVELQEQYEVEDEVDEQLHRMAAARKASGSYLARKLPGLAAGLEGARSALGGVGASWSAWVKRLAAPAGKQQQQQPGGQDLVQGQGQPAINSSVVTSGVGSSSRVTLAKPTS